ncbi:hypothetical protein Bca52824_022437 [Brassica carinata]|uniref:Uncharacterized protein n=1 Tax=Brassica carinata TaxID=52824 RepID=A0A8X7VG99_BRACI|nr:hypothetical protein Bca52824_022437 [Brassica carinata]
MICVLPSPSPSRRGALLCWARLKTPKLLLLQKLLSGETLGVEDFPAKTPPSPKVDNDTVPISVGKRTLYPIRTRRNLRPRKPWMLKFKIYHRKKTIKEMERNIRRDLGLPRESSIIAEEEAATIIMYRLPPTSSGLKPRPNEWEEEKKRFASASVEGDRLGHIKSVTAQYAPPDLSVEAQKSGSPIVDVTSDTGAPVDADERYDICKEDISADTQMQETGADQLSEPEEDSKVGAGKRQVEYKPMEETDSAVFEELKRFCHENTDS